jgi:hypothetical protein
MNILKASFKVYFKDGREFDQDIDLMFEHPEQISLGIDQCFARFYTRGYVEKKQIEEKLVCYGPHYIDRVEMITSRVQPANVGDMPPAPSKSIIGG